MQRNNTHTRQEMSDYPDRNAAIDSFANIDGDESIPKVLSLLGEIRQLTEYRIKSSLDVIAGRRQRQQISFEGINKEIINNFKKKIEQKRKQVTADYVRSFFMEENNGLIFDKIKKHKESDEKMGEIKRHFDALVFITCIYALYDDLDYKQKHAAETAAKAVSGKLKGFFASKSDPRQRDLIESPFIFIRECADYLLITSETKSLWEEVGRWLESMHLRTYCQYPASQRDANGNIKKTPKGQYVPLEGDIADSALSSVGLTKYYMSFYHKQFAEKIFSRLQDVEEPLQNIKTLEESEMMIEAPAPIIEIHRPRKKRRKEPNKTANKAVNIEVLEKEDGVRIVIDVANADPEKLARIQKAIEEALNPSRQMKFYSESSRLLEMLESHKNKAEDLRIIALMNSIERFPLSEKESHLLGNFMQKAQATLESYLTSNTSSHYIPTSFYQRPHVDIVQKALNEMKNNRSECESIGTLYDLWIEAIRRNSHDLLKKTTSLLNGIYDHLLTNIEPSKQFSK